MPQHFLGMPVEVFLRDYWQKKPLLIRQAFPGFVPPLSPEDLAGLACEEGPLSRIVTYQRKSDDWQLRTGPFTEDEFPELGHHDWTLLVQDMDKWDADVAELLLPFSFLPRWRIDDIMISFAVEGGSVGPHIDQYDVFLVQAMGRRNWQIEHKPRHEPAFRPDADLKLLQEFNATHSWDLEPGDVLYLPPGYAHHGVALDACMTFSVGMRAPSTSEMLVDFAEDLAQTLPEYQRYQDPDLQAAEDPYLIDEHALDRVDAALAVLQQALAQRTPTLVRAIHHTLPRVRRRASRSASSRPGAKPCIGSAKAMPCTAIRSRAWPGAMMARMPCCMLPAKAMP